MTKLTYKRSYAQFADAYLTTYYASGVQSFRRMMGGPFLIFIGAVFYILSRSANSPLLRWSLLLIGLAIGLYGLLYSLRPLIDLGLVWFRRDEVLGEEGQTISVQLLEENLEATLPEGRFEISYENILLLQRRTDASWIITTTDQIIQIPRENLLEGDHDAFMEELDAILNPPET